MILNLTMAESNESNVTNQTTNATIIILCFVGLFLSLIGNFLVVAVFYRNKTLRTPVHYFIVNMAVSDLIIPVVVLPIEIIKQFYDGQWMVNGVIGTLLCKLQRVAVGISTTVSILSMVSIAVDRFHTILFAVKPPLISRKTCHQVIVLTWITSTVFRVFAIYGYKTLEYIVTSSGSQSLKQSKQNE